MTGKIKKPTGGSGLEKSRTGISGFDEITDGGLPRNRPTILQGDTGCGKTIMSMEFLVNGVIKYKEPGVFFSFEETPDELSANMRSIDFDLDNLVKKNLIYIEHLELDKSHLAAVGKYDLEGLFVRLQHAIKKTGAKRVVLDSLDALFDGLDNKLIRLEIKRLFRFLKANGVTAIITSEKTDGFATGNRLEQFVADCVIALDNRTINQTTTRRVKIIKMRGSAHGINEYPFIISEYGISVLPLMSQLGNQIFSNARITSGIGDLDGMLDGKGFFEGSSILVSGSAGTGKTSIAVSLINAACKNKMRGLYCAFEESASQIARNMRSIGLNIDPYIKSGMLKVYSSRPTIQNLELHLIAIQKIIKEFNPTIIVLDPITNLMSEGINSEIRQMLAHFVDFLKGQNVTTLFTAAITLETIKSNPSDEGISAMMDTWILVRDIENNNERNRGIYVLKSRGMNHSTQVREFVITDNGIVFLPIYFGPDGILTGSAKLENTLEEEARRRLVNVRIGQENEEIERRRSIMEDKISMLKTHFMDEAAALGRTAIEENMAEAARKKDQMEIADLRNGVKSSAQKSKIKNK